jgi:pyruvate dehydrogenase E1 component alpha subunit
MPAGTDRAVVLPNGISRDKLRRLYLEMVRIRKAEEAIIELYPEREIKCPTHLSIGQEAVAVGVCAALTPADTVFSGHRCHAHYLAKGGSLTGMFAELYGKATGCCGGKGGSMHLAAPEVGMMGASAIVAGTIPLAVGCALAAVLRGRSDVAVAFFGDAAVEQGVAYESFQFAALKRLPVAFVCENNLYATHSHILSRQVTGDIAPRIVNGRTEATAVDGNDVVDVCQAAIRAVDRARTGNGPSFIEAKTYRWLAHVGPASDLDLGYRSRAELAEWTARDPITTYADRLQEWGILASSERASLDSDISSQIAAAVAFAKASPGPDPDALYTDID